MEEPGNRDADRAAAEWAELRRARLGVSARMLGGSPECRRKDEEAFRHLIAAAMLWGVNHMSEVAAGDRDANLSAFRGASALLEP